MRQRSIPTALALCFASLVAGPLTAAPPAGLQVWVRADIAIDATGQVTALKWRNAEKTARLIGFVDPVVRRWEFEPAQVDGRPAASESVLSVALAGVLDAKGNATLRIADATTGVASAKIPPPAYPMGAIHDGVDAALSLVVAIDAQGRVAQVETVEFDGSSGQRYRDSFEQAARKAVANWTFQPERVDGHPIASRARVPINFCVEGSDWCRKRSLAQAEKSNQVVAMTSVVKLKTPLPAPPPG